MSDYNQGGPSATSLNFIGFDQIHQNSINPLIYDRIVIQYPQSSTAGRNVHAAAGFVPGTSPYIKPNVEIRTQETSNLENRFRLLNLRQV